MEAESLFSRSWDGEFTFRCGKHFWWQLFHGFTLFMKQSLFWFLFFVVANKNKVITMLQYNLNI